MSNPLPPPIPAPRTSQQAVAAIVCAAVFFCPLTSFVGLVLGFRALRAIRHSEGRLLGRNMARSAVAVSLISLLLQLFGLSWLQSFVQRELQSSTVDAIRATFDNPAEAYANEWVQSASSGLSEDGVIAFVTEAETRYGPLQNVTIAMQLNPGNTTNSFIATLTLQFERGTRIGHAQIMQVVSGESMIDVHLIELTIEDDALGNLSLPPRSSDVEVPDTSTSDDEQG